MAYQEIADHTKNVFDLAVSTEHVDILPLKDEVLRANRIKTLVTVLPDQVQQDD